MSAQNGPHTFPTRKRYITCFTEVYIHYARNYTSLAAVILAFGVCVIDGDDDYDDDDDDDGDDDVRTLLAFPEN